MDDLEEKGNPPDQIMEPHAPQGKDSKEPQPSLTAVGLVSLSLMATASTSAHAAAPNEIGIEEIRPEGVRYKNLSQWISDEELSDAALSNFYIFEEGQPRIRLSSRGDCTSCAAPPPVIRPPTPPPPTVPPVSAPRPTVPTVSPPTPAAPRYTPPPAGAGAPYRPDIPRYNPPAYRPPTGQTNVGSRPNPRSQEPSKPREKPSPDPYRNLKEAAADKAKEEIGNRIEDYVDAKAREQYNDRIVDAGRVLWEAAKEAGQDLKDSSGNLSEQFKETISKGKQLLKDLATDALTERFSDGLEGADKEKFKKDVRPLLEKVVNAFDEGRETLKGRVETVKESGSAIKNFFTEKLDGAMKDLKDFSGSNR